MSWIRKNALWCAFAGAVAMALAIWGTWQGVHYTSSTEFCLSCHSMRISGEEYKTSMHFRNASGVRAECKDCHIPPGIVPTLVRKRPLPHLYLSFDRYPGKICRKAGGVGPARMGAHERE